MSSSAGFSPPRRPPRLPRKAHVYFDEAAADRVCEFFEVCLTHSKGEWAGCPFVLDPWQRDRILRPLFGLKAEATGLRWYRRCDVWLPKKNGKTTMAAGVGLYLTTADDEPGAEVYGVANDLDQARICWVEAARMVKASPELSEMCQVFDSTSSIIVPDTLSSYQAVGSDIGDKDGINVHGAIADELHEWRNPKLLTKLTNAQGARRQPVTFIISTAGDNLNGVGYREYCEDQRILRFKSKIQDRLVVIFEALARDNWKSRKVWKAANPGYGKTVKPAFLRSELAIAEMDPVKAGDFKRYYLNLWTGQTESSINLDKWDAGCAKPFDVAELAGLECHVGLDLAERADLSAAAAVFKIQEERRVLAHCFLPADEVEAKERRDGVPYREWAKAGLVTLTPGNVTDFEFIKAFLLNQWAKLYRILEVGYDPRYASQLALQLQDEGLAMVEVAQTTKNIAPYTRELKNLVVAERLRHNGNPVLRWMADNARSKLDADRNERFTKKASTGRIDALVAIIMALARATLPGEGASVYQKRGLQTL